MNARLLRQRELLRKIGVDVWRLRDGDGDGVAGDHRGVVGEQPVTTAATGKAVGDHRGVAGEQPVTTVANGKVAVDADGVTVGTGEVTVGSGEVVGDHREVVGEQPVTTDTLAVIAGEVSACKKCALHKSRTHTVFGVGDGDADWLFIGEAPGRHEDEQGEPFVGRAGQLLDKMIAALGMQREQVFIANVLKCRPPDNRDPTPAEVAQCEVYLHRQLAQIKPKVIVALGRVAAQALLKTDAPLAKLRGADHAYGDIPLVVTYHPAYLLRSPEQKAKSWEDLWRAKCIVAA